MSTFINALNSSHKCFTLLYVIIGLSFFSCGNDCCDIPVDNSLSVSIIDQEGNDIIVMDSLKTTNLKFYHRTSEGRFERYYEALGLDSENSLNGFKESPDYWYMMVQTSILTVENTSSTVIDWGTESLGKDTINCVYDIPPSGYFSESKIISILLNSDTIWSSDDPWTNRYVQIIKQR